MIGYPYEPRYRFSILRVQEGWVQDGQVQDGWAIEKVEGRRREFVSCMFGTSGAAQDEADRLTALHTQERLTAMERMKK